MDMEDSGGNQNESRSQRKSKTTLKYSCNPTRTPNKQFDDLIYPFMTGRHIVWTVKE
jgi:hypothetical protein